MQNNTTFAKQVSLAQHEAMKSDPSMICMGLGIDDPKAIFGTTEGLSESFGCERVFDIPTAENAMTGVGIGAAIAGTRVLMTHQRVDFFLLALDQLVNNAAKWSYMFNGKMKVPLTIRLIIGRGWGQGPTHQQSLQSWFAHIPGLKVVVPSLTDNVGQLLYQSIMDDNPTIFLEHRWLHNQECKLENIMPFRQQGERTLELRSGKDVTVITNSYLSIEALKAADELAKVGISLNILEVNQLHDVNWEPIESSILRTGYCIVTDIGHASYSISSEIAFQVTRRCFSQLKAPPVRLALPNYPEPTSFALTKNYYITASKIIDSVTEILGVTQIERVLEVGIHDIPGDWFKGPF